MKRALAIILALSLLVTAMWGFNPFSPTVKASAESWRGGFTVVPEKTDASGVLPDSRFYVRSESPTTASALAAALTLRGQDAPTIEQEGDHFVVTPKAALPDNAVVFIDIRTATGGTVTFAFQTRQPFGVLGAFPSATSTDVPLDTGIEIYFTHSGVKDFKEYFSISPAVPGGFEVHGHTWVFAPKKLAPGTIYTVTVKKGLPLAGTGQTLKEDYVTRFETSPDPEASGSYDTGYLGVTDSWMENGTGSAPVVPFEIYLPSSKQDLNEIDMDVSVFRYPSVDAFMKAVEARDKVPSWAWYSYSANLLPHDGLSTAATFRQKVNPQSWDNRYVTFPANPGAGFYLVELAYGDMKAQTFLQITDTKTWYVQDATRMLFWLNDSASGNALSGADVKKWRSSDAAVSDVSGLAEMKTAAVSADAADALPPDYFVVTTAAGRVNVVAAGAPAVAAKDGSRYGYGYGEDTSWWRHIGLDRTLYKPSDVVKFWGFVRSRVDGASPSDLTVQIASGGYGFYAESRFVQCFLPWISEPLFSLPVKAANGFFDGELTLPDLSEGTYQLNVLSGDKVIASTAFSVENYVKPAYRIEASSDRKAAFIGDKVTFTASTSFYEGTPVAGLSVDWTVDDGWKTEQGTGVTDANGRLTVAYTPTWSDGMQGAGTLSFHATARLPESGEISGSAYATLYANDLDAAVTGESGEETGTVKVSVHDLDLAPLNDDNPDNDASSISDPLSGRTFTGTVTRHWWERVEVGQSYDYINKVTVVNYDYRERLETVTGFTIKTGADGTGSFTFPMPAGKEGYYTAEMTTADRNGHEMKFETWHYPGNVVVDPWTSDWYSLDTDKDAYLDGEAVKAQVMHNDVPLAKGRTLFVNARLGLLDWSVSSSPVYRGVFDDTDAPNRSLTGVVFDGKNYRRTSTTVQYDSEEKRIHFTLTPDKDSYRPGETASVKVTAVDGSGQPVAAMINLAVVDEAMFDLSEQYTDVLASLYSQVDSGILREASDGDGVAWGGGRYGMEAGSWKTTEMAMPTTAAPAEGAMSDSAANTATYAVRSDFRDTAWFQSVQLDASGTGTLSFKLPDNVTSWRVSVSGISGDLHAGFEKSEARVTIPFFVSEVVGDDYLTGDKPTVGLTGYGTNLSGDETIDYEITSPKKPGWKQTARAKAFERVNLPLWTLEAGTWDLEIRARSSDGDTDAVRRTMTVSDTRLTASVSETAAVVAGMKVPAGTTGLTRLVFADAAESRIIATLSSLAWTGGKRLDQRLTAEAAGLLLKSLLPEDQVWFTVSETDTAPYRKDDGGYAILPYASSDLGTTAILASLLNGRADVASLKTYFWSQAYATEQIKPEALYGLAVLGEPVLLDLQQAALTDNLSVRDALFVGMGLAALGETPQAKVIYDERIVPLLERKAPYVRLASNGTTVSQLDSVPLTALAAVLAADVAPQDSDAMTDWLRANPTTEAFTGVEQLLTATIRQRAVPTGDRSLTIEWNGKTEDIVLKGGEAHVVSLPSAMAGGFKVISATEGLSVVGSYEAPFQGTSNDRQVSVNRRYVNQATGKEATTFQEGDIVRVELTWSVSSAAIDDTYEISDWLPSGLKPIESPWQYGITSSDWWYRDFEGQKATFVVGRDWSTNHTLVYYARIASPGVYRAEGTLMQGSMAKESFFVGKDAKIEILTKSIEGAD